MCALRARQEKMAEYLIHRGIDVAYEVDLIVSHIRKEENWKYINHGHNYIDCFFLKGIQRKF
jgi:hypothetical protein